MKKKEFIKQLESLEVLSQSIKKIDDDFKGTTTELQSLVEKMQVDNYATIVEAIKPENDNEETRTKIGAVHKLARNVGRRFFNLFRVTFSVEFAGVQLIYFQIPKLGQDEE